MKKMALALLLLQTTLLTAAVKPNPADFTIKVQVVSSGSQTICGGGICSVFQVLETVIDNQPVELKTNNGGVLALDTYSARLSPSIHAGMRGAGRPNSYDIYRGYDLLMPDGSTRTYTVTRLGPVLSHP